MMPNLLIRHHILNITSKNNNKIVASKSYF